MNEYKYISHNELRIYPEQFVELLRELLAAGLIKENPQNVEAYLNYLMIGKYVERIADHSTNVAEWIIYIVKNELK